MAYLVNANIDTCISRFVITSGKLSISRILNMLSILFKSRAPKFVFALWKRYMLFLCRYYHVQNPSRIFIVVKHVKFNFSGFFWKDLINRFCKQDIVVVNEGPNGNTRRKLYMLGFIFGFRHVTLHQVRHKVTTRRGVRVYGQKRHSKHFKTSQSYPMSYIRKHHLDCTFWDGKPCWIETGEVDDKGRELFKCVANFDEKDTGMTFNGPAAIVFNFIGYVDRERVRQTFDFISKETHSI